MNIFESLKEGVGKNVRLRVKQFSPESPAEEGLIEGRITKFDPITFEVELDNRIMVSTHVIREISFP